MDDRKRKQEELNRLCRLYCEWDKEFEKAKGRRLLITILGFSAFYFWLLLQIGTPDGWEILIALAVSIVFGGIHVFVNLCIFVPLCNKGREESERLRSIEKQIRELKDELYPERTIESYFWK